MKLKFRVWCNGYKVKWHCYTIRQTLSYRWLMIGLRKVQIKIDVEWPLWFTRLIAKPGQHDFDFHSFHGDPTPPKKLEGISNNGVKYSVIVANDMGLMRCRFCDKEYGQTGGQLYCSFEHFDIDSPCKGNYENTGKARNAA